MLALCLAVGLKLQLGAAAEAPPPADPNTLAVSAATALLAGDADGLSKLTPTGFSFDGRVIWSQDEIRNEWLRALERRSLVATRLYGVDVFGWDEMLKRYGKPPARLAAFNGAGSQVAVVNLGGRALVLVMKKRGDGWALAAVSD